MDSPLQSVDHQAKVQRVQKAMRSFFASGKQARIYHGGTNCTRPYERTRATSVDISDFGAVLSIDPEQGSAWVEPNVPMKSLVDALIPKGVMPPVVMELRSITVGGGIQGGAGESSSFRYGPFHDNCLAFEVVLGNGDVVIASPNENADLFYGLPCTYGTIGIITAAKLSVIPAKPFVRLRYDRVASHEEMLARTKEAAANESIDFIDGIMFAPDLGVLMTGRLASAADSRPLQETLRAQDDWFYLQAENIMRQHSSFETVLPIRDYFFRYNRAAFWTGRYGFDLLNLPFVRPLRFLLAPIFKTRILYRLLHLTGLSQRYLIQDCSLPDNQTLPFLEFLDKKVGIYPLWICPLLPPKTAKVATYGFLDTPLMINIGVWGEKNLPHDAFVALNRELEAEVSRRKGCKVLYAHSYYTREEFWSIYRQDLYEKLRARAQSKTVFPDIYDKIVVRSKVRPSIFRGLVRGLLPPYRLPLR